MPTIVISGARTGLGLEHIRQLSTDPSNTVLALVRSLAGDITKLREIQYTSSAKIHILECDTSSPASISALPSVISSLSPPIATIDVLINNAAILTVYAPPMTSLTLTPESLSAHMTTNVLGPALLTATLHPLLAPKAKIINITSGLASKTLVGNKTITAVAPAYAISKAALNMLSVYQAQQVGEERVVIVLDPGHCKTEMGGWDNAVLEPEDSVKGIWKIIGRLGKEDAGRFFWYDGTELPW